MSWLLIALKQKIEKLIPDGANRFWFYMLMGLVFICLGIMLVSCGATYTDTHKVETNWLGAVKAVEGGTSTEHGAPWASDLAGLLGSFSWLLVAGGILLLVLLWKFPSLWRTLRDRKAARAALRQP